MTRMAEPARSLRRNVASRRIIAVRRGSSFERADRLAAEEPMEIRAGDPGQDPVRVAVTMRTPGHDFELAVGFLFTEGLIASRRDVTQVAYCELPPEEQEYNVVTVRLDRPFDPAALQRNFFSTSSCGICGKASIDQVELRCRPLAPGPLVDVGVILGLPSTLRDAQRIFEQTGGLHAAGLFDRSGRLVALREDVGRHNALDKLVGRAVMDRSVPLQDSILLVSGRASFELIQKGATAGAPILCAVSAPSSLAVDSAEHLGMTLVGFLREGGFNVYAHAERLAGKA